MHIIESKFISYRIYTKKIISTRNSFNIKKYAKIDLAAILEDKYFTKARYNNIN